MVSERRQLGASRSDANVRVLINVACPANNGQQIGELVAHLDAMIVSAGISRRAYTGVLHWPGLGRLDSEAAPR